MEKSTKHCHHCGLPMKARITDRGSASGPRRGGSPTGALVLAFDDSDERAFPKGLSHLTGDIASTMAIQDSR